MGLLTVDELAGLGQTSYKRTWWGQAALRTAESFDPFGISKPVTKAIAERVYGIPKLQRRTRSLQLRRQELMTPTPRRGSVRPRYVDPGLWAAQRRRTRPTRSLRRYPPVRVRQPSPQTKTLERIKQIARRRRPATQARTPLVIAPTWKRRAPATYARQAQQGVQPGYLDRVTQAIRSWALPS
jgi:hypothetical protein